MFWRGVHVYFAVWEGHGLWHRESHTAHHCILPALWITCLQISVIKVGRILVCQWVYRVGVSHYWCFTELCRWHFLSVGSVFPDTHTLPNTFHLLFASAKKSCISIGQFTPDYKNECFLDISKLAPAVQPCWEIWFNFSRFWDMMNGFLFVLLTALKYFISKS